MFRKETYYILLIWYNTGCSSTEGVEQHGRLIETFNTRFPFIANMRYHYFVQYQRKTSFMLLFGVPKMFKGSEGFQRMLKLNLI